jgi:hypothetical protein
VRTTSLAGALALCSVAAMSLRNRRRPVLEVKAGEVQELASLFENGPPPVPQ